MCSNGIQWENQYCPDDLLFNKDEGVCDWPQNVDEECNGITPDPTEAPTEAPTVEPCEDGIYPHETDCNKFYQCSHGHRWPDQKCPKPLLFSAETNRCEHPAEVDCPDKKPFCKDGIYPVPGMCEAFYMCSNGIWWEKQFCPEGQVFNPAEKVCDWPSNVNGPCGNCMLQCMKKGGKFFQCLKTCNPPEPTTTSTSTTTTPATTTTTTTTSTTTKTTTTTTPTTTPKTTTTPTTTTSPTSTTKVTTTTTTSTTTTEATTTPTTSSSTKATEPPTTTTKEPEYCMTSENLKEQFLCNLDCAGKLVTDEHCDVQQCMIDCASKYLGFTIPM